MTTEGIAEILVYGMPGAVAFKTLAFLVLWIMLRKQESDTNLGKWINHLFLVTFLTSAWITYLMAYLAYRSDGSKIHGWVEWSLIVGLNALPLATTFAGYKVAVWTSHTTRVETKNERDIRQDAQQAVLDHTSEIQAETGVVLAKRGKRLSDAGIELDKRVVTMSEERQDLDDRRQVMNDEQAAGRSALDDTIIHTGEDVEAMKVDVEHIRDKMNGETP